MPMQKYGVKEPPIKNTPPVYNPSEFRWPLAVSVSDDGLRFKKPFTGKW
jgi:hypothetical protein